MEELGGGERQEPSLSEAHCCAYFLRDAAVSGVSIASRVWSFWTELHVSFSLQPVEGVVTKGCSG